MNNYCLLILPYISEVFLILYIHFSNYSVLNERKLVRIQATHTAASRKIQ